MGDGRWERGVYSLSLSLSHSHSHSHNVFYILLPVEFVSGNWNADITDLLCKTLIISGFDFQTYRLIGLASLEFGIWNLGFCHPKAIWMGIGTLI
jgi:hypothetical protein